MGPSVHFRWWWCLGAALTLGMLAIFRHVPEFVSVPFDDDHNISFNPNLGPLSWSRVQWAFTDWSYSRRCMPLGWLGFSAVFGWVGVNPSGWHAVNLLVQVASAVLLWAGLRLLARHAGFQGGSFWVEVAAFIGAAFWAWHPLRVESIGWSSGLLYGQAHCFLFASVGCWLRFKETALGRGAALLLYAGSLLTYPVALGFAPIFGLLEHRRGAGWRSCVPFLALAAAVAVANVAAQVWFSAAGNFNPTPTLAEFPVGARLFQAVAVYSHYLAVTLWPLNLTPVNTVLMDHAPYAPFYWMSLGGFLLVAAVLLAEKKYRHISAPFVFAYLAVLVPMLGLTERPHFPNDRYAGLPDAILAAALVLGLLHVQSVPRRLFAIGAAGALLGGAAWLSSRQAEIWRGSDPLWQHVAARLGRGAGVDFGYVPYAHSLMREGRMEEALEKLETGLRSQPGNSRLMEARAEWRAVDKETRDLADRLGLAHPPAVAAILHYEIARQHARNGEWAASVAHLNEVRRIAPDYYTRVTRAAATSVP
jgi:hypothetical protein